MERKGWFNNGDRSQKDRKDKNQRKDNSKSVVESREEGQLETEQKQRKQ